VSSWKYFVRLNQNDNVVTATKQTAAKTVVSIDSDKITLLQDVPLGHKFAIKDIEKGGSIIKYGVKIGISSNEIKKGEHVHIHNVDEVSLKIRDEAKRSLEDFLT
jgi:altronate dehydratase